MENKVIARSIKLLAQLAELHGENSFKVRAIANAAFKIDKFPTAIAQLSLAEIENIPGIGKSLGNKIFELIEHQQIQELQDLLAQTPSGILEMMGIKGLGPKKIAVIWQDLGIDTVGELYYACNENRLIEAKGFGLKTQEEIKKAIEFKMANNGRFLYAKIESVALALAQQLNEELQTAFPELQISFAGAFRRKCEIIDDLDLVIGAGNLEALKAALAQFPATALHLEQDTLFFKLENGLSIRIYLCNITDFYKTLFLKTGNEKHIEDFYAAAKNPIDYSSEENIYTSAGLAFIAPELREGLDEITLAAKQQLPKLIRYEDLKGSLHNHSTWSDGVHSLEEMARFCKESLNMAYFGICDHSKTAVYARGLNEERVLQQHAEIDRLNEVLAPFKIFKGIESDILNDGSLDYAPEILQHFDFVVASVHSNLRMEEDKATARLLKAIENPYTSILGHPTGRLLLSRAGYPLDFKKIIDACAANGVVIEINANPLRLDLDWRWHRYALEKGVILSINPDAHRTEGFYDMHYGVHVARKGGLSAESCLNAWDLAQISTYFNQRKSNINIK